MIDALIMGRLQATARAKPRLFIECFGFWLNTCNQKHVDLAFSIESVHFKLKLELNTEFGPLDIF